VVIEKENHRLKKNKPNVNVNDNVNANENVKENDLEFEKIWKLFPHARK
jgi:hypothetical protein